MREEEERVPVEGVGTGTRVIDRVSVPGIRCFNYKCSLPHFTTTLLHHNTNHGRHCLGFIRRDMAGSSSIPPLSPPPPSAQAQSTTWAKTLAHHCSGSGSFPVVVGSSAEMAKAFLKTHDVAVADRPKIAAGKYTTYNYSNITWSPYGPYWRQARKMCLMELFSAKRLESYEYITRKK
ncbi:hypothetical protein ACLB2K_055156 [Fragaria x ananassa]